MLTVTCNMYLTIITVSSALIGIILIFRYQQKMAALAGWIVGTFFVSSKEEKKTTKNSKTTQLKNNSNSNFNKSSKSSKETSKTVKGQKSEEGQTGSASVKTNEKSNTNSNSSNINLDKSSRRSPKSSQNSRNVIKTEQNLNLARAASENIEREESNLNEDNFKVVKYKKSNGNFSKSNSNSPKASQEVLTQTASVGKTESIKKAEANTISSNSERKEKKFKFKKLNHTLNSTSNTLPESNQEAESNRNSNSISTKEPDSNLSKSSNNSPKLNKKTVAQAAQLKDNLPQTDDLKPNKEKVEFSKSTSLIRNDSKLETEQQEREAVKTIVQKLESNKNLELKPEPYKVNIKRSKSSIIDHYKPKKNNLQGDSIDTKVESSKTSSVAQKVKELQSVESCPNLTTYKASKRSSPVQKIELKPKETSSSRNPANSSVIDTSKTFSLNTNDSSSPTVVNAVEVVSKASTIFRAKSVENNLNSTKVETIKPLPIESINLKSKEVQPIASNSSVIDTSKTLPLSVNDSLSSTVVNAAEVASKAPIVIKPKLSNSTRVETNKPVEPSVVDVGKSVPIKSIDAPLVIKAKLSNSTRVETNKPSPVDSSVADVAKSPPIKSVDVNAKKSENKNFSKDPLVENKQNKEEPVDKVTEIVRPPLLKSKKVVESTSNSPSQQKDKAESLSLKQIESEPEVMKMSTQIRVLTLNDHEHQDSTLYRIEKNWKIQFRLGPSLLGRKVSLYCNYPQKDGKTFDFDRNRYFLLPWSQDEGCQHSDDTALFTEIPVKIAGSFHYYFLYENATEAGPHGSGFFLVDPVLKYGKSEILPLNGIQCQTVLSKCLGSLSTWEKKLLVAKESGYNMIHFTPIQELGESNSAYSLSAQLKLNPKFDDGKKKTTFTDIENFISKMRSEWKVLSICDIVLNHTANETAWLQEHPDGTYNCFDCPYMRPAYLLDAALNKFSYDVKDGLYEHQGIPAEITNEDHLNAIRHALYTKVFPEINLAEMYICNVQNLVGEFLEKARKETPNTQPVEQSLKLIRDPSYRRLATTVDMSLALKIYNVYRSDSFDEDSRLRNCGEQFKKKIDELNTTIINEINLHLNAAVDNTIAGIRYFRVQNDGPNVREITKKNPLSFRYFTDFGEPKTMKEYEEILYGPNSKYLMAHNGWVMNADPMQNFADADSNVYIRRELIAWGDSVKLRFGNKPEDSPFLWNHMKNYVEQTARIFDGVRLDNCHSTPIIVAEYLLDCARKVRPDLYVVAELFTNSDHTDNIFVNRLGITSLIREAMSAWDSHEEGRLVHRFGGDAVGAFYQPHIRPLMPSIAHALFLDLTHDNPSPVEKRSVFDMLPSAALVNMACCASGSNRGYDELVNHHIHVVDETREYTEWSDELSSDSRCVSLQSGIIAAKKALNDLHFSLASEGYNQVYVDQMDSEIVAVTRHCPVTHKSVILVAFTAFSHPNENANNYQRGIKPLRIEGVLDEIILEATLSHKSTETIGLKYSYPHEFLRNSKWINGLSEYKVEMKTNIQLADSDVFTSVNSGSPNITQLNFKNFKPGSVVAIKVSLPQAVQKSIKKLRDLMTSFSKREKTDLSEIIGKLNLADLNRALYRCDQEERDDGHGFDVYNIPNFGSLVYCGLQGFMSPLSTIRPNNDLGHPICGNLRDGNWMIEYIYKRLQVDEGTKELGNWIENKTQPLKDIPRYLIPSYFDVIVTGLYMLLLDQTYNLMSDFVKNGSTFVRGLSLGSLQFSAVIKSADLPTLSPKLVDPKPPTRSEHGQIKQACVALSAGLPHFAVGYMRNWGRDTFIALRGLFILTGRFQDARYHILGYAACLRHGLIPNLLDGGRNSRFNCRDAVWWWLYCIKCYVEEAPNGIAILSDEVSRIFPTDDSPALEPGTVDQPLFEVIQEALTVHFQGLTFRERNAGQQIDSQMLDAGFNNQIGIHPETGFVFGGNEYNCGTWMDKMGSSDKAGNRGKPATPRDGSAIELIGLSKAVVTWLNKLNQQKQYPYSGVERKSKNGSPIKWSFEQWADKIQTSFEKHFWINTEPTEGEVRPDLINKRGIYKDCLNASQNWTDFQLRCNFPIAMVAAPELFNPKHAWIALENAEKYLLGPLGMKTLDASDWNYCGDYNNSDSSDNLKTANGFNYHQGPEWVWPVGFYLRAKLHFAAEVGELAKTIAKIKLILSRHFTELQTSVWRGLPELTNSNGSFCYDSSRTQAWSMSCILEVLHDLQTIESKLKCNKSN